MANEEDKEERMLRMRLAAEETARKEKIQLIQTIFTMVVQLISPILLYNYHQETVAEVKRVYKDTPSVLQVQQLTEKVDATNMQWKAYNTKKPEDEKKAAEVLTKAVENME